MMELSKKVAIDHSRRDFLTKFIKPVMPAEDIPPVFPDGVNILLLKEECIAWGQGICDRCERVCPEMALLFIGMMNPRVIESRCTYCNLCVPVCPVNAIVLRPGITQEREEQQS